MINLSLNVGKKNLFFAGNVNSLPVSQKTAIVLPNLATDIFEKNKEKNDIIKDVLDKVNIFSIIENENMYQKYFPSLLSENQFSKDMYFKASKEEKEFANVIMNKKNAYMQEIKSAEKITEALKQNLNLQYGKNNYSVLGIGRSASIVTELLKLNDVKSVSIPFTHGLIKRNPEYNNPDVIINKMDWKKYFAQFGFDEKTLTDKNKTTIVTDFVYTGNTMKYFKKMMDILYPNNNIKYLNISDLVNYIPNYIKKIHNIFHEDTARFLFAMEECDYKMLFSTCPHLYHLNDYKNYKHSSFQYPLFTKLILLNYLDNKFKNS